jgi:hypothetical protein
MEISDINIINDIQNELDEYLLKLNRLKLVIIYKKILEIHNLLDDIKKIIITDKIYSI